MQSYLIERNFGPVTPDQVAETGSLSKRVANEQFSDSIVWRQSYATQSDKGLRTYCVYDSTDEATIRAHAQAAGMPCDRIMAVDVIGPNDFS